MVGKPVTGEYFIDREEELKKITLLLSSSGARNNVILSAQRRTGKSSILYNLKEQNPNTIHIVFDAYGISTKERFAKSYVNSILGTYAERTNDGSYRKKIKKILGRGAHSLQSEISDVDVTVAEFVQFHVRFREASTDPDELLENALNFAEVLAKEKKVSLVVMIDEFQELLKWKGNFLKIFRKSIQVQQNVSYVLSGSAPTVMHELVYMAKSPLYRQLIHVPLNRLPKKDIVVFVKKRLATADIKVSNDTSEYIFELSRGYADYVQRLGMQVFLLHMGQKSVTRPDVSRAYEEMLVQLDADFGSTLAQHSELEREILIALASGKDTTSAISLEVRKPQSTLPKTMNRLIKSDVIERHSKGKYRMTDGVFSDWICKQTSVRNAQNFRMSLL